MNIDIYNMREEYVCSSSLDEEVDFEPICAVVIQNYILSIIQENFPVLAASIDEVRVEWIYEGYRIFLFGTHLTETEIDDILEVIDPINLIGYCKLYWDESRENRPYTGLLLAYDTRHFHRVRASHHSFVIFTYAGLDEFLKSLGLRYNFEDPRVAVILNKIQFRHNKLREREAIKEKMRGFLVMPPVEMKQKGKMHTNRIEKRTKFDNYWEKRNNSNLNL